MRVKEEAERQLSQASRDKVQYDLHTQSLQTSCEKLRLELTARMQDIEQ